MKLSKLLNILITVFIAIMLTSCASTDGSSNSDNSDIERNPDSNASPDAYGADGFIIKKKLPTHSRPAQQIDFFFKHCMGGMGRVWYSKTSYDCERP